MQISYDRQQIIRHGLDIDTVANQVRDMVKGAEATRLNRRDRRVPIVVRLAESDRQEVADIGQLTVNPGGETAVPLNAIAEMSVGEGPSEIRRIDGKRVALVQANIGGGSLGGRGGSRAGNPGQWNRMAGLHGLSDRRTKPGMGTKPGGACFWLLG